MRHDPIRSVLVGVDLPDSGGPDPILAAAVSLANGLGAGLHVVHAVESGPLEPPLPPALSAEMETARAVVDEYLEGTLPAGTKLASTHVGLGRAHRIIAERATELDADLLVLGPHRGSNLQAQLLGTTADRILRTTDMPCWVVRGPLALPLTRVTAPIDFSEASARSLAVALAVARRLGTPDDSADSTPPDLDVLYVEWSVSLTDDPGLAERALLPKLHDEVERAESALGPGPAVNVRPWVVPGVDPARGILEYADEARPGVMVLGTHGRGAVSRALIGDVASTIARRAPCHVVLVPPAQAEP